MYYSVPDQVGNVTVTHSKMENSSLLCIEWDRPIESNGVLKNYTVTYRNYTGGILLIGNQTNISTNETQHCPLIEQFSK